MGIVIKTKESFAPDFKLIRKKEYYEPIILKIMNDSKIVFPSNYSQITEQSHGEADFIDNWNKQKYDAKLLFKNELCQLLSKEQYFDFVKEASDYFGVDYINIRDTGPYNEPLYIEMKKRIESLEPDEHGILFLPLPVLLCSPDSIFADICSDQIDWFFSKMNTKKTVYFIGMTIEQYIVIKKLGSYSRTEYLASNYFNKWIDSQIIDYDVE